MNEDEREKTSEANQADERRRGCSNCSWAVYVNDCDGCSDYDPHDPTDVSPFRDVRDWKIVDGKAVLRCQVGAPHPTIQCEKPSVGMCACGKQACGFHINQCKEDWREPRPLVE